jgi:hypothetical protein
MVRRLGDSTIPTQYLRYRLPLQPASPASPASPSSENDNQSDTDDDHPLWVALRGGRQRSADRGGRFSDEDVYVFDWTNNGDTSGVDTETSNPTDAADADDEDSDGEY